MKNKHINIKDLTSEISHLGNVNSSNEDYMKVLECLSYENPTSISPAQFDAILIKAAKTKLKGIRVEFTLMALGLLSRHERDIDIGTRRVNYLQHSNYTLEFVKKYKGFYNEATSEQQEYYMQSLMKAERFYIEKLADFLAEKMKSREFDEFIKDLKDYYDSDTDTTILPEPEYIKKQRKILKPPRGSDTVANDLPMEPTPPQDKKNQKDKGADKITKSIYTLAGVCAAGILILGIIKPLIEKTSTSNAPMDIVAPDTGNVSSAAEAYINKNLLIEMESFSIEEDDKLFPLAPGYSRKLPIKDPVPLNADMRTVNVESSDKSIVWEKDGYLTASDNIPEGAVYDVYITIRAKDHTEIICITVENPVIADDAEGLVGDGKLASY